MADVRIVFDSGTAFTGSPNEVPVSASNPLPVNASVSASISGFTPNGNQASLSATTTTSSVALPSGATAMVSNLGSVVVYVKLGVGAATATTSDIPVPAGGALGLTVGSNTFIAGITASGSATVNIQGGSGLATNIGGGSSGGVASTVTLAAGSATIGALTANQSVNVGQVGGTSLSLGQTTMAASIPIAVASNQSAIPVSGTIAQVTTISGLPALPTGTNSIGNIGTVATLSTITALPSLAAGANNVGTVTAVGAAASGASVAGNPVAHGARAQNAEATAVTNGQAVFLAADLLGRGIVFPYANKENIIQGSTSTTGTAAATIIASPGASLSNYITSLQFSNTSTTAVMVTLNDSSSSQFIVPASGGSNPTFPLPLKVAANTALTAAAANATTTLYFNAQGFKGA